MRIRLYPFLLAALALPVMAAAVNAAPADEKADAEARLDTALRKWAAASDAVRGSHFTIRCTETDRLTDAKHVSDLEAFIRKPDLIRIDYKFANGEQNALFLYSAGVAHLISAKSKSDLYLRIPNDYGFPDKSERYPSDWPRVFVGAFLERQCWLAFGLPIRDLKSRFDLRLAKEDDNWIYLEIEPRAQRDKDCCRRMQVVLSAKSFLPRRLWLEQSDESELTYDFEPPKDVSEKAVTAESILKGIPDDYKKVDMGWPTKDAKGSVKP